ncbi:HD domain-containing protein [Clostridium sp. D2Q-11]|uniref:HD domain-containing protein n=1 Tax=Anaeromonas frigoriresistens TaxID=2683708 RepID=A0A942UT52_9FIRM|nr:HD domain-containing protein [Anaeromonas frigoriresistens]
MNIIGQVIDSMIRYYSGDVHQINHFLKVHGFAKTIGEMESIDKDIQELLEIAAVMHDIGIKNSEKKYNSSAGSYQQIEGPPEARRLLEDMEYDPELIERVCWLIAHHHTYDNIEGMDYQILVEADFLVNAYENNMSKDQMRNIYKKIFKTSVGKEIFREVYNLE